MLNGYRPTACAVLMTVLLFPLLAAADLQPIEAQVAFDKLRVAHIDVEASSSPGALELWRHGIGHGGINSNPLPNPVVEATAKLKPRLIRVFIQEFFAIYPEHGKFDWSRLDPYMDSFARTGAKVVAAITIKPRPLYPKIDPAIWRPGEPTDP